ncbi:A/G-specific adenine glycosylase [Acholeplasma granularum]|uniref:A/G-specific adenine glycosylase n=1 Tax=Acholeplasma granularum TaxID=264635 RepID=UPI000471A5E9|nr:A/G-specific adenine glycosylase [Acholeplasma granularum]
MEYLRLFNWYYDNKRDLPFRKTNDPYHIWVSEIMLQQTQVDTMLPFYERFLRIFPTIESLAHANIEEVLRVVQGIGYYKRFRMLHKGAQYVINNHYGKLPDEYQAIIKIPGIGPYTAGAILSIAFNKPFAATDGNVIRVLSRKYQIDDDFRVNKNKIKLDKFNQSLIEQSNDPYTYTQSMMELGAMVCKPQNPLCKTCPFGNVCLANLNNVWKDYPKMSKLKEKKEIHYFAFIIKSKDGFLMRKRTEDLLHGFYEFIQVEADSLNGALNQLYDIGLDIQIEEELNPVKHIFTHLVWHIKLYRAFLTNKTDLFERVSDFKTVPVSTVVKKQIVQIK